MPSARCRCPLLPRQVRDDEWQVTSSPQDVQNWEGAFVGFVPGRCAVAARDGGTLELLCDLQTVDPSLWKPASKDAEGALDLEDDEQQEWFMDVLTHWLWGMEARVLLGLVQGRLLLSGQNTPPPGGGWVGGYRDGWVGWPQISAFWATRHPPPPGCGCAFWGFWVCAGL